VRALDYCPPVDITFGDFLRALITSDLDLHPSDRFGVRDALMQGFRLRGIIPGDAAYFSDQAIAWPPARDLPPIDNLEFGDPNGLTKKEKDAAKAALKAYVAVRENRVALDLDPDLDVQIPSFHPVFRVAADGSLRTELIVELIQERSADFDATQKGLGSFPVRGGATVIIGKPSLVDARREDIEGGGYKPRGIIRYVISKKLTPQREQRQRASYQKLGLAEGNDPNRFSIDFALVHSGTR
jgi:hypothetical protein